MKAYANLFCLLSAQQFYLNNEQEHKPSAEDGLNCMLVISQLLTCIKLQLYEHIICNRLFHQSNLYVILSNKNLMYSFLLHASKATSMKTLQYKPNQFNIPNVQYLNALDLLYRFSMTIDSMIMYILEIKDEHSYLGITLHKSITWTSHISKISTKASQIFNILR